MNDDNYESLMICSVAICNRMDPPPSNLYGCEKWGSFYVMSLRLKGVSCTHSKLLIKNCLVLPTNKTSVGCHKQVFNNDFGTWSCVLYTAEHRCDYVTEVILFNFFELRYALLHWEILLYDTHLSLRLIT